MNSPTAQILSALLGQLPLLAAYVAGMAICAMRWNRDPRPAQMAFLGTAFLLMAAVGQPVVGGMIVGRMPATGVGEMLSMLSLVGAVVRMTGYGFLLGAVFFGRGPARGRGFDVATTTAPRS